MKRALLGVAEEQDRKHAEAGGRERERDAAASAGELLDDEDLFHQTAAHAAVGLGQVNGVKVGCGHLLDDVPGELLLFIKGFSHRFNIAQGDLPRQILDLILLLGQIVKRVHKSPPCPSY